MSRRVLAVAVVLFGTLAMPAPARAQAFQVEKIDIKGEGGTDYVAVEAATGRVFISRATHMIVVDGATGKVIGDIRIHRASMVPASPRKPATGSRRMVAMKLSPCST